MKNKQAPLHRWFLCNSLVIGFFKLMATIIIIIFLFFGLLGDFSRVLGITMFSVIIYIIFTVAYLAFSTNEKDISFILNSWKLYIPTVFILGSIQFNTIEDISNKAISFYKTTLDYHISMQATDEKIHKSYHDYKNSVDSYLSQYEFTSLSAILTKSIEQKPNQTMLKM